MFVDTVRWTHEEEWMVRSDCVSFHTGLNNSRGV